MNKTFIIKMNGGGGQISQVWECGASQTPTTGSNSYYLSTAFNTMNTPTINMVPKETRINPRPDSSKEQNKYFILFVYFSF